MPLIPLLTTSAHGTLHLPALHTGTAFAHGQLRHIQTIGPYTVVTFHPWLPDCTAVDHNTLKYYPYVDGQPTGRAWPHLDRAIAAAIAYRTQGNIHFADTIFMKLLGA